MGTTERDGAGPKYDGSLGIKEIAVRVRADLADAIAAGELPEMKVSVRIERYSGGRSLHLKITQLQPGFRLFNRAWLLQQHRDPHSYDRIERYTGAGAGLLAALKRIGSAYNYDRSDPQADYSCVNYYLHSGFDWRYEAELQAQALAEALDPKFVQVDLEDGPADGCSVFCDCCLPSHLDLAAEPRKPELGGTCQVCGATRAPAAPNVAPNVASLDEHRTVRTAHFTAYSVGVCSMSVCTTLPRELVARRANIEVPTGIGSDWKVAEEPTFHTGQANGCPCEQNHAPGARHWLLHC